MFRVGDRVVVVEDARIAWDELKPYRGKSGIVSLLARPIIDSDLIRVGFTSDGTEYLWFFPEELELVTDDQAN